MLRKNLSLPGVTIACVTDNPEGIDNKVKIIPIPKGIPPFKFQTKLRQFPRLLMFHPEAEKIFGDTEFICMDLDCVVLDNIDSLLQQKEEDTVKFFYSERVCSPYSLCMQYIKAGSHPEVFTGLYDYKKLTAAREEFGKALHGPYSDNLWIRFCLGNKVKVWTNEDGVYSLYPELLQDASKPLKLVFSFGDKKPWSELPRELEFYSKWYHSKGDI